MRRSNFHQPALGPLLARRVGFFLAVLGELALLLLPAHGQLMDFNNDGKPDLLWRNKATGENAVWLMNGSVLQQAVFLQPSSDLNWKMVGAGFFNSGTNPDILWQHLASGEKAVWFMNGTTLETTTLIKPDLPLAWKVKGTADFNADGKWDLLWQNESTGEKAIWLMDGITLTQGVVLDSGTEADLVIGATGQFGGDATPDIVLRHKRTGALTVWIMNGTGVASKLSMDTIVRPDLDWQLVGAADFNGNGKTDLFWRHAALGLNFVSFMNGTAKTSEDFLQSSFDTDWRAASQDMADTRYRLNKRYGPLAVAAFTKAPTPSITLHSNFEAQSAARLNIYRRPLGATNWGTAIAQNLLAQPFTDLNVAIGQCYEYQITVLDSKFTRTMITAGIEAAPWEARGKMVILVDRELASRFPDRVQVAYAQLREDLVTDGWTYVRKDVPRHDDRANNSANEVNRRNIADIKTILRAEFNSGARGVIILGHVAIPYSGTHTPDGHSDHVGAWPADMYYGDVDGVWTDGGTPSLMEWYPELNNVPGDGKFTNNFAPSNLEMFVGRVDFSRMSLFGTGNAPTETEAKLLQQYFVKAHRYRFNLAPYPVADTGAAYGYFSTDGRSSVDVVPLENALRNYACFFPNGTNVLTVGDSFLQQTKSYLWGFLGGNGSAPSINAGMSFLEHSTGKLVKPENEPRVAFQLLIGSYFGDWNMPNDFMRATLATPNYGLFTAWMAPPPWYTRWRFHSMAMGDCAGTALLATVNDGSPEVTGDNNRMLALLGDPTLRLHILTPPGSLSASTQAGRVDLEWTTRESGQSYFVYRAASRAGPFARISPEPILGTRFTDDNPLPGMKTYMVRALKLVTSGTGSYTNLSQGVMATAP